MSSTYYLLCASHDPATYISGEWSTLDDALSAVVLLPSLRDDRGQHALCDLVIARSSGGTVELTCPPMRAAAGCKRTHSVPITERVEWLRLLYLARQVPITNDGPFAHGAALPEAVLDFNDSCWKARRLERLAHLIGVTRPTATS